MGRQAGRQEGVEAGREGGREKEKMRPVCYQIRYNNCKVFWEPVEF